MRRYAGTGSQRSELTRQKLANLLRRHQASGLTQYADLDVSNQVDSLIIIDRSVDWVTPMCTQLTYEGMLDEFVGISNCMCPNIRHLSIVASLDPDSP